MFDKQNRRNGVGGRENVCHEKWKIRSILCGYKFNSHATGHHPESRERQKMNKKMVLCRGVERKIFTPDVMEIYIFENCHMHKICKANVLS